MSARPELRAWLELALAALGVVLLLLTLFWRDWLEAVFGVDPDGHDGFVEWLVAGGLLALSVVLAARGRADLRVARHARGVSTINPG